MPGFGADPTEPLEFRHTIKFARYLVGERIIELHVMMGSDGRSVETLKHGRFAIITSFICHPPGSRREFIFAIR